MNEELKDFFNSQKGRIDKLLPTFIEKLNAPETLKEAMQYSLTAGGKRIRPMLVLATINSFNRNESIGLEIACALEMIHTYSLIHDDLPAMDNDDFRRGRPTNHKVFGEALAILAGDGLLTYSFEMIADIDHPMITTEMKLELIKLFAKAAGPEGMVGGQVADMEGEGKELSVEELEYIHHHKTGDLLTYSVEAGAILSGASDQDRKNLTAFARELGLVFQIKDDILDVEGDAEKLGKPVGSDMINDKITYPSLLTLAGAKEKLAEHTKLAKEYLYKVKMENSLLDALTNYIVERDH
jgi:geranylgeranyl diphosphate synthase type II